MSNAGRENQSGPERSGGFTRANFLKRGALVTGGAMSASAMLAACGGSGAAPAVGASSAVEFPGNADYDKAVRALIGGKTLKIGFTPPIDSEFFSQMHHAAWAQLNQYKQRFGVNFVWENQSPTGNFNTVEQTFSIIQNWITRGFDAICVCTAADFAAMQRVYASALAKGIAIYQFNMPVELWPVNQI